MRDMGANSDFLHRAAFEAPVVKSISLPGKNEVSQSWPHALAGEPDMNFSKQKFKSDSI